MASKKSRNRSQTEPGGPPTSAEPGSEAESQPSANVRSCLSLFVFAHFFLVAYMMAANVRPSRMQENVRRGFSGYLSLLNFDPQSTPLHWTRGEPIDDDFEIEFTTNGSEEKLTLPASTSRISPDFRRWQTVLRRLAVVALPETEDPRTAALIARSLARHCYQLTRDSAPQAEPPTEQPGAVLRLWRRLRDREQGGPAGRTLLYAADTAWADGQLIVVKRAPSNESAQVIPARSEKQ